MHFFAQDNEQEQCRAHATAPARLCLSLRRGFTLIELLVVLVIMGIIGTAMVMTTGDSSRRDKLHEQAERLRAVMQLALDEAQLQGVELGLAADEESYVFMALDQNRWLPIENDKAYAHTKLEQGFALGIKLEEFPLNTGASLPGSKSEENDEQDFEVWQDEDKAGDKAKAVDLSQQDPGGDKATSESQSDDEKSKDEKAKDRRSENNLNPQIYFMSSGELNPFLLSIGSQDEPAVFYRLRGSANGEIRLEGPINGDLYGDIDVRWQDTRAEYEEERKRDEH